VAKSDLIRTVVIEAGEARHVVPDPRGQRPGRGAHLHPDLACLELAERRRAFPRAFRLEGPLDSAPVRAYLEAAISWVRNREAGREVDERSMSTSHE
jgi:predicted RNA-binding protein YlxR (DUF448 family)